MEKTIFKIQGGYYFLTGIWPILHLVSFLSVTGPKTDLWLVQMVGLLSASIGVTLFFKAGKKLYVLAISTAISFAAIDCWYAIKEIISPIYLADAALQLLLLGGYFILWIKKSKQNKNSVGNSFKR